MLEGVKDLTLELLNEATAAWVEADYNRRSHSEIGTTPLSRFVAGPDVSRSCPGSQGLKQAFRCSAWRTQRQSDGTITVWGRRFEVPNRFRHMRHLRVRFARWDFSTVDVVDPRNRTGVLATLYPLDKTKNAEGRRRALTPLDDAGDGEPVEPAPEGRPAPMLRKMMADRAATGLPPAYLADHRGGPKVADDDDEHDPQNQEHDP
jgi:hypothetical protein